MAPNRPETYIELKEYCLRKCGKPVIDINIADEQIDDAIADALDFFKEYHIDTKTQQYMSHQLTEQEVANKELTLPENVIAVTRVYNPGSGDATSADALFDVNYQLRLNDVWDMSGLDMTYYYLTQQYWSFVQDMLVADIRYDFNPYSHTLRIHSDMENFNAGGYILIEVYTELDFDVSTELWGHWVLRDLAAEYVKYQWGSNLIKFQDVKLPGGTTMNGEKIIDQAQKRIEKIKEDFIMRYQEPDELIIR